MKLHKNLSVTQFASWPWKQQFGHIASEFARAHSLQEQGAAINVTNCLERARELVSFSETASNIPPQAALVLKEIAEDLKRENFEKTAAKAKENYDRLMALWEEK